MSKNLANKEIQIKITLGIYLILSEYLRTETQVIAHTREEVEHGD